MNFKKTHTRLIITSLISLSAGLIIIIYPEKTNDWIIRGIGLIWSLEGIVPLIKAIKKRT